jgi:hypothetical protein
VRTITPAALLTLLSANPALALLLELGFAPALYFASSAVSLEWNSITYIGAGSLGAVDPVKDSSGQVQGLQFTLSGVPSANLALALGVSARNRAAIMRLAIVNPVTHVIEDAPVIGTYVLDQMPIVESGETCTIGVTAYPLHNVFQRVKSARYTDGDQKRLHSGDRCLEFIVSQANHQDVWPAASFGRK